MEKNYISHCCSICSSSNVTTINKYISDIKTSDENSIKTVELKKNYSMKCNDCNNEYTIAYCERYELYDKPLELGEDLELLASYETQDSSNHDYELISIDVTPYDDSNSYDKTYLLCCDEKYPIRVSKDKSEEILNEIRTLYNKGIETNVDKKLTYNTFLYRKR